MDFFEFEWLPILSGMKFLYETSEDTVDYVMTHPNVIELIESGKTFNACIIENTHFEALMVSKDLIVNNQGMTTLKFFEIFESPSSLNTIFLFKN